METVPNTGIVLCTGFEPGLVVGIQSGSFFDFDASILRTLLARPGALGVRLHFDQFRPNFPTELYAAASDERRDIRDSQFDNEAYFKSTGENLSRRNLPEEVKSNFTNNKLAGSAFFSRTILERPSMLGPASSPSSDTSKIRFYVKDAGPDCRDSRGVPCFTLVAIGLDNAGMLTGPYIMSAQPCPPNCPTGDE